MTKEESAKMFADAIRNMTDAQIDNLEYYLSVHFDSWIKRFANTPAGLATEMKEFANVDC